MSLVAHAKQELEISGAGDDYDGMIGGAVMELIETFADQGHSGYSASVVVSIFNELAQYKPLGPLTTNPDEWMDVSEYSASDAWWQSRRRPDAFSTDGGKTYTLIDDDERTVYESQVHDA